MEEQVLNAKQPQLVKLTRHQWTNAAKFFYADAIQGNSGH